MIERVGGPRAWRPSTLDGSWQHVLTEPERAEIRAATSAASGAGWSPVALTRDRFPLPTLSGRLRRIAVEVGTGLGFALLRGIPVDGPTDRELELVSHGLGAWLACRLIGDGTDANPYTTHLRDVGLEQTVGGHVERGPHTDVTDWLTLLCHRPALAGGASGLSSLATVHDVLLDRDPAALATAYRPLDWGRCYACGRRLLRPGFVRGEQRLFGRSLAVGRDGATATADQVHAARLLAAVAEEPDVQLRLRLAPGDLLVVDNTAVLHARGEFVDGEPPRSRHLLRLHLEPDPPLAVPPAFDWRCAGEWHEWAIPTNGGTVGLRPVTPRYDTATGRPEPRAATPG